MIKIVEINGREYVDITEWPPRDKHLVVCSECEPEGCGCCSYHCKDCPKWGDDA